MRKNKYEVVKKITGSRENDGEYLILGNLTKEQAEELVENLEIIEMQNDYDNGNVEYISRSEL